MESNNFQDVTKRDPVSVHNHFLITDILGNWEDIALKFPSAHLF